MLLTPTHVTDSELKKEKEDPMRRASHGLAGTRGGGKSPGIPARELTGAVVGLPFTVLIDKQVVAYERPLLDGSVEPQRSMGPLTPPLGGGGAAVGPRANLSL